MRRTALAGGVLVGSWIVWGGGLEAAPPTGALRAQGAEGAACIYEANEKTTPGRVVQRECVPVQCLEHCANYISSRIDEDPQRPGLIEEMEMNLVHCTMVCYSNERVSERPTEATTPRCLNHADWNPQNPQNWVQDGTLCDEQGTMACLKGECVDSTEYVLRAVEVYLEGRGEASYLRVATRTTDHGPSPNLDYYAELARLFLGTAALRPPGPLKRPDFKAVSPAEGDRDVAKPEPAQPELQP